MINICDYAILNVYITLISIILLPFEINCISLRVIIFETNLAFLGLALCS